MEPCITAGTGIEETGFGYTMSLVSGKYKMIILYWLAEYSVLRYNELKRRLGTISHKTLSLSLKELEAAGLVRCRRYPQIPPKVEYSLSERGAVPHPHFGRYVHLGRGRTVPAGKEREADGCDRGNRHWKRRHRHRNRPGVGRRVLRPVRAGVPGGWRPSLCRPGAPENGVRRDAGPGGPGH